MPFDSSYEGNDLVFLLGCPRSGTTWMQRLIGAHPAVETGRESHLFEFYLGPTLQYWQMELEHLTRPEARRGQGVMGLSCYFERDEFMALFRDYSLHLLEHIKGGLEPGRFFLEKTPGHALFIPEIRTLFPQCKIIHLLRDPRAVTASMLAASKGWAAEWAPPHVRAAAWTWRHHVEKARKDGARLPQDAFLEVRYEDARKDTAAALRRILDFLGLEWSDDRLRAAVEDNRPGAEGTPVPLHGEAAAVVGPVSRLPEGHARNAPPKGWRRQLSLLEKLQLQWKIGSAMRDTGYRWRLRDWLP